jgi:flagellar hook-associated protein 3 FlgL
MERVSTSMIPQTALNSLSKAQATLVETARQSSAQTKAEDLKGYAREAQTLVSAQRLAARTQGFIDTGSELRTRMELQDVAIGRAADIVSSLKNDLFQSVGLEDGSGVRSRLEEAFAVLKDTMNISLGGRYLFGGVLNDRPPVKAASLSDLAANPISAGLEQDAPAQAMRIEDNRTIDAGVVADDIATRAFGAIKRLAEFDAGPNGPFSGSLSTAQQDAIRQELGELDQAFNRLLEAQSENGRLLNEVESAGRRQSAQLEALGKATDDIVKVDLAEVAVRLNQAQYAYEAAAGVFSTLRDLSLLNYLR